MRRVEKPIPPVEVTRSEAPCKEVILRGEEASFTKLPIPIWHPGDGGPYITLGIQVCRDPVSGASNLAILRQMIVGPREASLNALPGKRTYIFYKEREKRGEPLEVAVVIGVEPAIQIAACHSATSLDEDEYAVAGALKGEPIEVVKCETIDVMVPARAEVIIEGIVPPHERVNNGKFGEFTGYMSGVRQALKFVISVSHTGVTPSSKLLMRVCLLLRITSSNQYPTLLLFRRLRAVSAPVYLESGYPSRRDYAVGCS